MVEPGDMQSIGTHGEWTSEAGDTVVIRPGINTSDFEAILTMTCTIERNTGSTPDESGKNVADWTTVDTEVDCFFESYAVVGQRSKQEIDTAKTVVDDLNLMLKATQDVLVGDRVTTVARKLDDSVVAAGPLYIQEANNGDDPETGAIHHIECILKREEGSP
jgi:hypothetical protein